MTLPSLGIDSTKRTVDRDAPPMLSPRELEPRRLRVLVAYSGPVAAQDLRDIAGAFQGHDVLTACEPDSTILPFGPPTLTLSNNTLVTFCKALIFLRQQRPSAVVTCGTAGAGAVALAARFHGTPVIHIESSDVVAQPTLLLRVIARFAESCLVQWPTLGRHMAPRAQLRGSCVAGDSPFKDDRSRERRMKVTLVQPAQIDAFASDQPPMGLAYIASVLQQTGCEVRIIDANVEKLYTEDVVALVAQQNPNLVCFTITTPLLPGALEAVRYLRKLPKPPTLIAGGPHATVAPDELLQDGMLDFVVRGEGERTMAELADCLIQNRAPDTVAGLSWRRSGAIVHNPDRALCDDLEQIPYPDWSIFPLKRYSSLARRNDFSLPITTSRGCPYNCSFCYKGVFGTRMRLRSPEHVVDEWAFLIQRYGAREVAILDDLFTFKRDRALAICELLKARALDTVPWSTTNGIRVDNVTPELFAVMHGSGCYRVYFGIESGVERILRDLNKKITIDQVRYAVSAASQAGLEVGGYFMLGNIGETVEDMETTIRFALDLDLDFAQFSIATPYPGSQMFNDIVRDGKLLISSWEELATYGTSVFMIGDLNPEIVGKMFRKANRQFYFRPRTIRRQLRQLLSWTGFKHLVLGGILLLKLTIFGGRRRVSLSKRRRRR